VHSMDRLARNLGDLRHLVKNLTNKGNSVFFIKEGLTFNGEDSPMSNLLLSVMGAFSEFERALIKERQHEGIVLAKNKGVYKGRKQALRMEQITELTQRAVAGENKTALVSEYKISRQTLYSYLKGS